MRVGIFVEGMLFAGCSIVLKSGIAVCLKRDEKCAQFDIEPAADSAADIDGRRASSKLYIGHVSTVDSAVVSKFFLRKPLLLTKASNRNAELYG